MLYKSSHFLGAFFIFTKKKKMEKQIFINLPVADVNASFEFYTALGFGNNPQFSDDNGKCMVWSDNIFVMIMNHEKFASFINKPMADTKNTIAALLSLSVDNIDTVNQIVEAGKQKGGKEIGELKDYGFMQQRSIEDLDGHTWEIFCMDMSKMPTE